MLGIVEHCLGSYAEVVVITNSAAGVGVAIEAGEVATGYLQPDYMTCLENIARSP